MESNSSIREVVVTGGAGYVGSELVPALLAAGYRVRVLDLYIYGRDIFSDLRGPNLVEICGDIRDPIARANALEGADAIIHLACISNDPSYDLDPTLGRSINFDAFDPLVQDAKLHQLQRFIYASSSSVYGIKDEPEVTEDLPLQPLTDYSKYKAMCEVVLAEAREPGFTTVTVRPSTVCGYGRRLRLDLVVNILTNHAYHHQKIRVFGGSQLRPNIHIKDMVDLYLHLLRAPAEKIDGQIFNAGYDNFTVMELANMVSETLGGDIEIQIEPTDDLRSYHVSSKKMKEALGFSPKHSVVDAIRDLKAAFDAGLVPKAMNDDRYYNIKKMQALAMK